VDLVASIVSELPLSVYSGEGPTRRKRPTPGYLEDPDGSGHGRQDWTYQLIQSWFMRGNVFGQIIDQGPTGMIRQTDLYHPDTVSVSVLDGVPSWSVSGQPIASNRFYHKRINPVAGTLMGLSQVQAHAATLGLSISATRFGVSWFQDGGHPTGLLTNDLADLSDENVVRTAKDRFMAALYGTREPVVLGKGWKYSALQVTPEESQFLETQGYAEAQCARIVGPGVAEVLGYDTGGSMTYSNMVDRDIALLKYTVGKVVNRIERVWFGWLPRPQVAILERDAFLETNAMQRWQVNKLKLDTGAYKINEIRADDNQPPVEWGDEPMALTLGAQKAEAAPPGEGEPTNPPGGAA
jgi:HK97 family phage portal protein